MDDVIEVLEQTDWDDPADADWAMERLFRTRLVPSEAISVLHKVALDVDCPTDKRVFAIYALSQSSMSLAGFRTVYEVLVKDEDSGVRFAIWTQWHMTKFDRSRLGPDGVPEHVSWKLTPSRRSKRKRPTT